MIIVVLFPHFIYSLRTYEAVLTQTTIGRLGLSSRKLLFNVFPVKKTSGVCVCVRAREGVFVCRAVALLASYFSRAKERINSNAPIPPI